MAVLPGVLCVLPIQRCDRPLEHIAPEQNPAKLVGCNPRVVGWSKVQPSYDPEYQVSSNKAVCLGWLNGPKS